MASKNDKNSTRTQKRIAATKKELLENLREWAGNIKQACRASGVDRSTFYRYRDEDPEFAAEVETINEESKDDAEWVLLEAMRTGQHRDSIKAAEIYLKARAKERGYGTERREQTHSGSVDTGAIKLNLYLPDNGRSKKVDD